jgi:hypothetical protein
METEDVPTPAMGMADVAKTGVGARLGEWMIRFQGDVQGERILG